MNDQVFTVEDFHRMKANLKAHSLAIVGIVCRPSLEMLIRQKIIEESHSHFSSGSLVGLPVYSDLHQFHDILTFTDEALLRAYLQRREKPDDWARAMMRGLMRDKSQARKYGIPFRLPPVVEV